MKILNLDRKNKQIVFSPQSLEDLWTIKSISSIGDVVSGDSYRRQRVDQLNDSTRKPFFVFLEIEKFDFSSELTSLRFTGLVKESRPSDIAAVGDHHTLEIQLNSVYTLDKIQLFDYQIELLNSSSSKILNVFVVALDNDSANVFCVNNIENKLITTIDSNRSGKRYNTNYDENTFFSNIYETLSNNNSQIIVAGPGGTKTRFKEFLKLKNNKLKVLDIKIQNVGASSLNELFTKKEVQRFFENSILFKEKQLIDKFLENLGKNNGKSIYGFKDIINSINQGACENILISEKIWKQNLDDVQNIIKDAEKIKSSVHIVENKNKENVKTINSFGGIIANLRFKI